MYRLIINETSDRHYVAPVSRGRGGWISTRAALILEGRSVVVNTSAEHKFLQTATSLGWLIKREFQGTIRRIQTPYHLQRIQIELSTRCNLKCSYCYSESGPSNQWSLKTADVITLLSEAEEMGVISIDFTGGEVLTHPDWEQIITFARSKGFAISIHTNGTPLNNRNVHILKALNVSSVQVSLDSHRADVHDYIRGLRGAFDKTMSGIERAINAGLRTKITLMVHSVNVRELEATLRALKQRFGNRCEIALDRLIPTGGELNSKLALSPKDFFEAVSPFTSREVGMAKKCESPSREHNLEPHCGIGANFAYITSEGEIAVCPTMTSRDHSIFAGPNLKEMSLSDAWLHHPTFKKYRLVNCENVSHCPSGESCRGGCRSNAYFETGNVKAPDVMSCNIHKNSTTQFIDFREVYRRTSLVQNSADKS